jgi:hypothetical protein
LSLIVLNLSGMACGMLKRTSGTESGFSFDGDFFLL